MKPDPNAPQAEGAPAPKDWGRLLQTLPRPFLFLLLILAAALPLFGKFAVPDMPLDMVVDFYTAAMQLKPGSTVLVSTEWTNGTRAESRAEFEALIRILMYRKVKFVLYSIGDPQAPAVANKVMADLNVERVKEGLPAYARWTDWVDAGYFPNAEGTAQSLTTSVSKTFASRNDIDLQGNLSDVTGSPVFKGVQTLKDVGALFEVTASATSTIYLQRISGKVPFYLMVTGVMMPEAIPYYQSGQASGLVAGLKPDYDLEELMVHGVNEPGPDGKVFARSTKVSEPIPGFVSESDAAKFQGAEYTPALHTTLLLLILAIVVGNAGMFMTRAKEKRKR